MVARMGSPATLPTTSPARTRSPISLTHTNGPSAGLRSTRSAPAPAITPGTPVLAAGEPS